MEKWKNENYYKNILYQSRLKNYKLYLIKKLVFKLFIFL